MLKLSDLQEYDYANAKVGDKVFLAIEQGFERSLYFEDVKIKSVSAKRGDITLDGSDYRFDKTGRQLGRLTWSTNDKKLCSASEENVVKINAYNIRCRKVAKIEAVVKALSYNSYEKLLDDNIPDNLIDNVLSALTAIAEK